MAVLLDMRGIVKRYPGALALDGVDFTLTAGEVHCLVGENGAGKSTLMKVLSGAVHFDAGTISIDDNHTCIDSPGAAQRLGIGIIYQDYNLVPEMSVAENIFLGRELTTPFVPLLARESMDRAAAQILEQLDEGINPSIPVRNLSAGRRQIVEIAKALSRRVRILAMDEPTAPLSSRETETLFGVIRRLTQEGVGIIYISHRLDEIFDVGDRVTVLRDGRCVGTCAVRDTRRDELIRWMVGRDLQEVRPGASIRTGDELLRAENLEGPRVRNVSFSLHRGEILGVAGLVGAGRSEMARLVFGAEPATGGSIYLEGREIRIRSPYDAVGFGIGLLTEDRNRDGLVMQMNVRENITLASLRAFAHGPLIDQEREEMVSQRYTAELQIRAPSTDAAVETLSGGNRQKVVLARWLNANARVLIFDEPTAGIDIGVKLEIYALINRLAERGLGILLISSDLPELLGICHRIMVLCEGRVTGIADREDATQEQIMTMATTIQ